MCGITYTTIFGVISNLQSLKQISPLSKRFHIAAYTRIDQVYVSIKFATSGCTSLLGDYPAVTNHTRNHVNPDEYQCPMKGIHPILG